MTYYIKRNKKKTRNLIIVGIISFFAILVFFHHGTWSYSYSIENPTWNKTKCDDMAYDHFLQLGDWP